MPPDRLDVRVLGVAGAFVRSVRSSYCDTTPRYYSVAPAQLEMGDAIIASGVGSFGTALVVPRPVQVQPLLGSRLLRAEPVRGQNVFLVHSGPLSVLARHALVPPDTCPGRRRLRHGSSARVSVCCGRRGLIRPQNPGMMQFTAYMFDIGLSVQALGMLAEDAGIGISKLHRGGSMRPNFWAPSG